MGLSIYSFFRPPVAFLFLPSVFGEGRGRLFLFVGNFGRLSGSVCGRLMVWIYTRVTHHLITTFKALLFHFICKKIKMNKLTGSEISFFYCKIVKLFYPW